MNKSLDIDELLTQGIYYSIEHGRATESGDYKYGNKCFDLSNRYFYELYQRGEEGIQAFLKTLFHDDPSVRASGAVWLLKTHPAVAVRTLEEVSTIQSVVGFAAKTTLDEWHKGRLVLPQEYLAKKRIKKRNK